MKKVLIFILASLLLFAFMNSCRKKVEEVPPAPPTPQEKEQPKVEKVEEVPEVKEPEMTEEEIFMSKSLEEINEEMPLKMIHFDFDKYFIREDAKPMLEENAVWLKNHPTVKIVIEGHCDERGTEEYNLALGEKRAQSTHDYLVSLGISRDRMRTISYGKSQPIDLGHNEIAWQKNRRAQFTIYEK
ncbi:MAG: peptidoglycan-associated lipoprotein Pal [Candidatus Aminicenantaceae bacterium]